MNKSNVDRILLDLKVLRQRLSFPNIEANIFLKPTKPTKEMLAKYEIAAGKFPLLNFSRSIFYSLPRIFMHTVKYFLRHWKFKKEFEDWKQRELQHPSVVFLSHFFGAEVDSSNDNFFGTIPRLVSNLGQDCIILFINHSNTSKIPNKSKLEGLNCVLLPRTRSFRSAFLIFIAQFKLSLKMIKCLFARDGLSVNQKQLFFELAVYQTHPNTLLNIILWQNLRDVLDLDKTNSLFITLEGHAYEDLVCKNAELEFKSLGIYAYQHAPIVMNQFGLDIFLNSSIRNVTILTSGLVTRERFLIDRLVLENSIFSIGSSKAVKSQYLSENHELMVAQKRLSKCILFAPEGVMESTLTIMRIALDCAYEFSNFNFVVRVHPHLSTKKINAMVEKRSAVPRNFLVSSNSLNHDLESAICCIYRSSAVAIEGLSFGVQPFFLSEGLGDYLDPIDSKSVPHVAFRDQTELKLALLELETSWETDFRKNITSWIHFQRQYFGEIDLMLLSKLFPN